MDWMNKLLYGPEYGPEDDMAIEQALTAHNDGPAPSVTNPLTYAECVHSIRTGVLPTGQVLQTGLDGYTGRSVLIDLHGCPAAKEVASALGGNEMRTLFAAHLDMQPTASANGSALTAAAAARLLASAAEPFALSLADVKARLLHPTLLDQVGRMLCLDSVSQGLSEEDMLNLQTTVVDESVSSSHPWMASDAQPDACVEDDILDVRDVLARVQGSINTFEDGPPKVHVAIVRDNTEYFAIAWQLSLQHNATLRRHRREPTPPPPTTEAGSGACAAHEDALRAARQGFQPSLLP